MTGPVEWNSHLYPIQLLGRSVTVTSLLIWQLPVYCKTCHIPFWKLLEPHYLMQVVIQSHSRKKKKKKMKPTMPSYFRNAMTHSEQRSSQTNWEHVPWEKSSYTCSSKIPWKFPLFWMQNNTKIFICHSDYKTEGPHTRSLSDYHRQEGNHQALSPNGTLSREKVQEPWLQPCPSGLLQHCTQAAPPVLTRESRAGSSGGTQQDKNQPSCYGNLLQWRRHHTSPLLQLWGIDKELHEEFPCSKNAEEEEADKGHQDQTAACLIFSRDMLCKSSSIPASH